MSPTFVRNLLAGATALGALACSPALRAPRTPDSPALSPLEISTGARVGYAGTMVPMQATMRVGDSIVTLPADSVQWESAPLLRAWARRDGIVQLHASGRVTITAKYHGFAATRSLIVKENPTASVVIDAGSEASAQVGDTVSIHASALDRDGAVVTDAVVSYGLATRGALEPGARISLDGKLVAEQPGTYLVIATVGSHAAHTLVRVGFRAAPQPVAAEPAAVPDDQPAHRMTMLAPIQSIAPATSRIRISGTRYEAYVGTAMALEARIWTGDEQDTTAIARWKSSDTSIAIVNGLGEVVFARRGQVTITASHGGKVAAKRFNVLDAPVADLVVRSNANYARAGDEIKLSEWAWAMGGTRVTHARANYAILSRAGDATSGATISESGSFVATIPGTYTIIAQLGGLASATTFVVHPAGGHCELHLKKWDPSCAN